MQTVDFLPGVPHHVLATTWGGIPVALEAQWNFRGEFWGLSVTRADTSVLLISGMPIMLNMDLFGQFLFGLGVLLVQDTLTGDTPPTLTSLGATTRVFWLPASEFA